MHIRGRAALSEDPGELLRYATEIGGLLVRITPERVTSKTHLAGY